MRRWICWVVTFVPMLAFGQAVGDFQSFQSGPWNDVTTWERFDGAQWVNPVPSTPSSSDGIITILAGHTVNIPAGFSVTIDQTTIAATGILQIDATGTVTVANGTGTDLTIEVGSNLDVSGELICSNSAVISGSTTSTTVFQSGSVYEHQYTTTEGSVPLAQWDVTPGAASTLRITGYTTLTTATAGGNWGQSFGNVIWNCAVQTATLNLGGLLTSIDGDLTITSTGTTGVLRFVTTGSVSMDVAGNFSVSGGSRIGFCTSGTCTMDIGGNYTQSTTGTNYVRLADGSSDGIGTMNITGNFELQSGVLSETGGGSARGNINFVGAPGTQHSFTEAGTPTTTMSNSLAYTVEDDNELRVVGESQVAGISGGAGSFLTVGTNGILILESTDAAGAIQNGGGQNTTGGNIRITTGNRVYNSGAEIIYAGSGAQFMGTGNPTTASITTIINNNAGVTQVAGTTISLAGSLTVQTGDLTISNASLTVAGTADLQGGDVNFTSIGNARTLTFNGDVNLGGDILLTSGTSNANLVFAGDITGGNTISFSGVNSNLTLNGSGDLIFPLAGETSLENLTCNRAGTLTFNETLNVNTNAGASVMSISAGDVEINGDLNGRNITITNASGLLVNGNTALSNTFTVTSGTVVLEGTLSVTNDLILTSGTLDANGSVTITDDLTLGAGTIFYFEDQDVTLNSALFNSGGVFSSNENSSLNILNTGALGTIAFDASGNTLGSFTLDRPTGGTLVTLNSALTVNSMDLTDGIFLNSSGLDFGSGAVVTRTCDASFQGGSAIPTGGPYDVFLTNGTATSMTTGVELRGPVEDVTSSVTGTVTLSAGLNATGNLTISSGTWTSGANAISVVNFTNNGTTFNAPSSTFALSGDIDNNGAFNRNNGTVDFTGFSTISSTTALIFQNIIISGTLTSPVALNLAGNFTNNGIFIPGTGEVSFRNTTNGTKVIDGSNPTEFFDIQIENNSASPDVSMDGVVTLSGTLRLETDAVLDADGAGSGVLTLLSTADNPTGDASIASLTGTSSVTGNVTVQRFMSIEGPSGSNNRIYRYISSPVQNAAVSDIQNEIPVTGTFTGTSTCSGCLTNQSMFYYDETVTTGGINGGYVDFPDAVNTEQLVQGRGYALFVRGNIDPVLSQGSALYDVRGPINSGTISLGNPGGLTFTSSGVAADDGWHLVGNPFPSTIDWNAASGWVRPGSLDATIYFRDNGNDPQQYATFNGTVGTNGGSRFIASGQAFWVKMNSGPTATLSVNENVKVAGTQTTFFREGNPSDVLRITLRQGSRRDEAVIHFREDATPAFDNHADAWKLNSPTLNLSTATGDGEWLSINSIDALNCSHTVDIAVTHVTAGNYTLEFSELESFTGDIEFTLTDQFTGTQHNARTGSYDFQVTADPASFGANRFKITIGTPEVSDEYDLVNEAVCLTETMEVRLVNTQTDVVYQAFKEGVPISEPVVSQGGDLAITVYSDSFLAGEQMVNVRARVPSCVVDESFMINVVATTDVAQVESSVVCQSGTAQLQADGASGANTYVWYASAQSQEILAEGSEFVTPVLNENTSYFVAVKTPEGCVGVRTEEEVIVQQYEPVDIEVIDETVLRSSYTTGNQWFKDNVLIPGATAQELTVSESGTYKVEVALGSCTTSADMPMVITATETTELFSLEVFPNPTQDNLYIRSKVGGFVQLVDSRGVFVAGCELIIDGENYSGELNLAGKPNGLYLVKWANQSTHGVVKIIKK